MKKLIFLTILIIIFAITTMVVLAVNNRGSAPVAYWKFDEGYGTTAFDAAGSNDGTITNALWRNEPDCKSGKCLYFDGDGDKVTVGDIDTGTSYTVSAWIRTPDTAAIKQVLTKEASGGTEPFSFNVRDTGVIRIYARDDDSDAVNSDSTTIIDDNKWHHIAGVRDGTTTYIYVDGVQEDTDTNASLDTTNNNENIIIGDNISGDRDFLGYIDEPKIYNYARTAAQIKADYLGGAGGRGAAIVGVQNFEPLQASQGLVGHWKLNESSGNAVDSSGAGLTLTNNNTVPFVAGKFGNSADFTPASSHNFSTATSVASVKTVAFWTYPDSTTNNYFDLASGVYLTSSSGTLTATGFTSPVIYVNGVQSSTIAASAWSHIAVVTNTGVTSNAIAFGKANSAYFDGKLDDIKIYNTARSASQIRMDYETGPPPVSHWKMDEKVSGDSQTIYDTSGSNNGTTVDGANNTGMNCAKPGKYGSACEFDGVDDYVDAGNFTQIRSVSVWFKHNSPFKNYSRPWGWGSNQFSAYIDSAGTLTLNYTTTVGTKTGLSVNTWYHFAATYNGTTVKGYLNGVEVISGDKATDDSLDELYIGSVSDGVNPIQFFNGLIDDVRIYNYARTQKQIMQDMNAGHPAVGSPVGSYVGYWDFNEGQGATAYDKSNNNNDGAITGADWTMNGKFGGALDFVQASVDYVSIANESNFDFERTNSFTLSAWIKTSNTSDDDFIIAKQENSVNYRGYSFYVDASPNQSLGINLTNVSAVTESKGYGTIDVVDGTWHHVAMTYNGTSAISGVKIYVDGVADTLITITDTVGSNTILNNVAVKIGSRDGGGVPFNGTIDEVKIYPFALTPAEVKQEYNRGASIVLGSPRNSASTWDDGGFGGAAPIAIWKMDEKANNTCSGGTNDVCDTSANSNDGAITGATWKSAGECKLGSCLWFDGGDDYVSVSDHASLDITSSITIETWVKLQGASGGNIHPLVSKWEAFTNNDDSYLFSVIDSTNKPNLILSTTGAYDSAYDLTAATVLQDNTWYHLTALSDGTTMKIYVNGVQDAQTKSAPSSIHTGALNLIFGMDKIAGPAYRYFNGLIDDVRIYNYARTAAQIAWDYNRGKPKLHWKLDENTGAVAYDYYKTKNGTITGPDWTGAADQCKLNYCLSFTAGNSDYVAIGDTGVAQIRTLSFWAKPTDTTEKLLELSASDSVEVSAGVVTATGFGTETIYVDGKQTTSFSDANWHHITVVSDTDIDADAVNIGKIGATYYTGLIDDVKIYNYGRTQAQILQDYNEGAAVRIGPEEGLP